MKMMRRFSIKKKLILIILGISSVAIILALSVNLYDDIENYKSDLISNAEINAGLIGKSCMAPLLFGYSNEVKQILMKLNSVQYVLNAFVFDADYEFVGAFNRFEEIEQPSKQYLRQSKTHFDDDYLIVTTPIIDDGDFYGTIYMRVSTEILKEKTRNNVITLIVIIFGTIIFSYILSVYFQRIISGPIVKLTEVTNRIAGQNDYSIRVKPVGNDEITDLYKRFNYMFEVIESREEERNKAVKEIENLNRDLERKVSERTKELEKAKTAAENASKAKSELLSNVSHELRTPLNIINGNNLILAERITESNSRKMIGKINTAVRNLTAMVNNIIYYSESEVGTKTLSIADFNIELVFQTLLKSHEESVQKKGLEFRYEIDERLPEVFKGDSVQLLRAIELLVDNAVKYTESGYVLLKAEMREIEGNRNRVGFVVQDTGIGIKPDKLGNIFNHVSQIDGSSTRKYGGIGLGLTLCNRIVELLGGKITVNSEPGKGSEFQFNLAFELSNKQTLEDEELKAIQSKYYRQLGISTKDKSDGVTSSVRQNTPSIKPESVRSKKEVKSKLQGLRKLLEDYNADAGKTLSDIGIITGYEKELIELHNNINEYDFEAALLTLNKIKL